MLALGMLWLGVIIGYAACSLAKAAADADIEDTDAWEREAGLEPTVVIPQLTNAERVRLLEVAREGERHTFKLECLDRSFCTDRQQREGCTLCIRTRVSE